MFKLNRRDIPKIRHSLQFVDALWTKEERDKTINKRLSNLDAIRLHETINKRVIKVAHLLKEPMPASLDPQSNAKSNMQGLGNSMSKFKLPFKLEECVPNWDRGGKIKAPTTLMTVAINRANKMRISQKNTHKRNSSSTRTAARAITRMVPAPAARTTTISRPLHIGTAAVSVQGTSEIVQMSNDQIEFATSVQLLRTTAISTAIANSLAASLAVSPAPQLLWCLSPKL